MSQDAGQAPLPHLRKITSGGSGVRQQGRRARVEPSQEAVSSMSTDSRQASSVRQLILIDGTKAPLGE